MATFRSDPPFQLVDQHGQVEDAITAIKHEELVAVDCEGVNLCRDGTLTLLTVGTRTKTFLFDVMEIGAGIFDRGLREIIESTSILKLVFDCRRDSDALWHIYKVKLANVADIQLMQVLYERKHPDEKSRAQKDTEKRFAGYAKESAEQRVLQEWPRIRGLAKCIEWYLKDSSILTTKTRVSLNADGADINKWGRRPLTRDMQLYAAIDVYTLFPLYDKFKRGLPSTELAAALKGSEKYLGFFRDRDKVVKNPYEDHSLLHMYILEDRPTSVAQRACHACSLTMPASDINYAGLCRLCQIKKTKCEDAKKRHQQYEERERKRQQQRQRHAQQRYYDSDNYGDYY